MTNPDRAAMDAEAALESGIPVQDTDPRLAGFPVEIHSRRTGSEERTVFAGGGVLFTSAQEDRIRVLIAEALAKRLAGHD